MDIIAVMVTFNRLDCLKKALQCYENQSFLPKELVVVNNCSSDGTSEFLNQWKAENGRFKRTVIELPENTGGAGGFHTGMAYAIGTDNNWVWVSDDDAYPKADAFEMLYKYACRHETEMDGIASLCGAVWDYEESKIMRGHRCREGMWGITNHVVPVEEYNQESFDIDYFSYVGTMISMKALHKAGISRKDFFIYSDDWEHSMRIGKCGRIVCVPEARVLHVGVSGVVHKEAVWGDYYETRNTLVALRENRGFGAFLVRIICRLLTAISYGNVGKIKIFWAGIRDAWNHKMGVHPVYKPGWKVK